MNIYKLIPIEGGFGDWEQSAYKGLVVVRAASEGDARIIAASAFGIARNVIAGAETKYGPWLDSQSVHCELVSDNSYPNDGPQRILMPDNLGDDSP